jgi:uncharacterized protein YdaU (DUF1376 family)
MESQGGSENGGKMNKPPAFQFYPSDWLSSTKISLMTPAEEGAYIRLLCHAWGDPQCSLPNDDEILSSLSRLGEGWFNGSGSKIKRCFRVKGNRLINERLKIEREKQRNWREKSMLGGINSGISRRHKELQPKGGSLLVQTKDKPKGNSSVFSLQSSSSTYTYKECVEFLKTIPNYPFNEKTDLSFLQEKQKDYPTIDVLSLLKGWKAYLIDKPLTKKSNPRAQLHNQFEHAVKWGRYQKGQKGGQYEAHSESNKISSGPGKYEGFGKVIDTDKLE